jgi:hypothetical protein
MTLLLMSGWNLAIANDVVEEFKVRFPDDIPLIEGPPGSAMAWIARKMLRNGLPMSIRAFATPDSSEDVAAYFLHDWKKQAYSPNSETLGEGKRRVGALIGEYYVSVQTYPTSRGSEGFIVVTTDPVESEPSRETTLSLPRSLRVVTKDEYLDDGIVAESLTAVSDRSIRVESSEIARHLRTAGWAEVPNMAGGNSQNVSQMEFQKNAQQIQVTLKSEKSMQKTVMLLHWRKN